MVCDKWTNQQTDPPTVCVRLKKICFSNSNINLQIPLPQTSFQQRLQSHRRCGQIHTQREAAIRTMRFDEKTAARPLLPQSIQAKNHPRESSDRQDHGLQMRPADWSLSRAPHKKYGESEGLSGTVGDSNLLLVRDKDEVVVKGTYVKWCENQI